MFPADHKARMNGQASINYEAARRLFGEDAEPFVLKRTHDEGSVRFEASECAKCEDTKEMDPRIKRMAEVEG